MPSHRDMDSLPTRFVLAMRTLFDIMDDKHTGYVKLADIENRWREDRTRGLPRGVIESLQKVACPDGLLTFETFCTGLKICLLRNQVDNSINARESRDFGNEKSIPSHRSLSTHNILDLNDLMREKSWNDSKITDSSVAYLSSMPEPATSEHQNLKIHEVQDKMINLQILDDHSGRGYQSGPPKPPRLKKPEISHPDSKNVTTTREPNNEDLLLLSKIGLVEKKNRGSGDGRPDAESFKTQRKLTWRREPRRHTLHNGVDYNLLKRLKQIEQEKDILLQGLTAVEEAREWYLQHLMEVQEKMRYVGRMGVYVEPWSEAQQERLELLRARVSELNRQLRALAAPSAPGARPRTLHMNLALPAPRCADITAMPTRDRDRSQHKEEVDKNVKKISFGI